MQQFQGNTLVKGVPADGVDALTPSDFLEIRTAVKCSLADYLNGISNNEFLNVEPAFILVRIDLFISFFNL